MAFNFKSEPKNKFQLFNKNSAGFTPLEVRGFWSRFKNGKPVTGFTIIEALVIIAVLAAIASVVLDNITVYTSKAKDAAIKISIGEILVNGSIYFEKNGSYNPAGPGDFCTDTITTNIFNSIVSTNKHCNTNANRWRACARLNLPSTGTSQAWCADNTGTRKQINNSQCNTNSTPCP